MRSFPQALRGARWCSLWKACRLPAKGPTTRALAPTPVGFSEANGLAPCLQKTRRLASLLIPHDRAEQIHSALPCGSYLRTYGRTRKGSSECFYMKYRDCGKSCRINWVYKCAYPAILLLLFNPPHQFRSPITLSFEFLDTFICFHPFSDPAGNGILFDTELIY